MPTSIVPLNQAQKMQESPINELKVLSPANFYTCPAGKKAKINGTATVMGFGAAADVYLDAGSVRIAAWTVGGPNTNNFDKPLRSPFTIKDVILTAGQTLSYSQNGGTNAEMQITAQVLELPV